MEKGLLEPQNTAKRHNQLAKEMTKRGYKHQSPLRQPKNAPKGLTNKQKNKKELTQRCEECKKMANEKKDKRI